jgi:hypothetical protein
MSLTSYRAAPPRVNRLRSECGVPRGDTPWILGTRASGRAQFVGSREPGRTGRSDHRERSAKGEAAGGLSPSVPGSPRRAPVLAGLAATYSSAP